VGNARRDAVVSYAIKLSLISKSTKTQW
jgi:hypothetical protein